MRCIFRERSDEKGDNLMFRRICFAGSVLALFIAWCVSPLQSQQKPQWMPGQVGLNAGIAPSPGFSYVNITENYDAGAFTGPAGNPVPATGTYNVWAIEDIFYYVTKQKLLGGNVGWMLMFPTPASGSLVADIRIP